MCEGPNTWCVEKQKRANAHCFIRTGQKSGMASAPKNTAQSHEELQVPGGEYSRNTNPVQTHCIVSYDNRLNIYYFFTKGFHVLARMSDVMPCFLASTTA